ncbi:MAG TPA: hypothetical protein VMS74_16035 [Acidimicrobiia bacterium]|nr:hypothetical protein [Acidimicrobiia bacterium]
MSVIVGGSDPDATVLRRPNRPRIVLMVALATVVALAIVLLPSPRSAGPPPTTSAFARATPLDTGRWIPLGTSPHAPFDARRLGERYVFVVPGGVATIDAEGTTTMLPFAEGEVLYRLTSDGDTAVVHGNDASGPVLWRSTDASTWNKIRLPWTGSVQAVAIQEDGLVLVGIDTTRNRQVAARTFGRGWAVTETDAPDTGLVSTGTGMIGRGRLADGTVGYLYSTDGTNWEPAGLQLSLSIGEVITLHQRDGVTVAIQPGETTVIRPPELPIVAFWRLEDRYWLQTPSAVWWSTDASRWSPLALDRARGIERGAPVLLPFSDRALLSVGGARGTARELFMWILGA